MWYILALLSALFQVLRNLVMKQLGHELDETINVWGRFTFILPFAALGVVQQGVPAVQPGFWLIGVLFAVSQIASTLCLSRALHHSQISLATALWKISVVVLLVWGFIALDERPSALGLVGVLASVVGVYLLNVHKARIAWWAPLAALVSDTGQRWALGAAVTFAPAVVFIKQMALLSDPTFAVLIGYVFCSALITPYTLYRSAPHFRQVGAHWKRFLGLGLFAAGATWSGTTAYTMTLSSYVEAIKQVEILFALAIGHLFFKEGATIRLIWPGALVMLLGMVLIRLGG